jgi:hypothetical protein
MDASKRSTSDSSGRTVIAPGTASPCRVSLREPRLAAPYRSSHATITLVSTCDSPTRAIRSATGPSGCRTRWERMFVSSR